MSERLRYLMGHSYAHEGTFGRQWLEAWAARLRAAGFSLDLVQIGLDVPGRRLPFAELDRRWKRGDARLMRFYEKIATRLDSYDVLINAGALNLHPEFLRQLPVTTVLQFNDDPESADSSRPVAAAHDLCCIGNIAEVETYRSWGVQHVHWAPVGFRATDFDPRLTEDDILHGERDVDVSLLCERITAYRRRSVDTIATAFPRGVFRGPGWPSGFLPEEERVPLLQRTRVGINLHNSTGPINFRTYYLPANGVLQICDNKSHLGSVFELGVEVVGYASVAEAIDLCRYYLAHEQERRSIAAAGWRRATRDYNEVEVFRRMDAVISAHRTANRARAVSGSLTDFLSLHARATHGRRVASLPVRPVLWLLYVVRRAASGVARRLLLYQANLALRFRRAS
jgi:spore maturation protein CgeB